MPLSRRELRHAVTRARNARIAELRDDRMPLRLELHPLTWEDVLLDSDPAETEAVPWAPGSDRTFYGIHVLPTQMVQVGEVDILWPPDPQPGAS